MVWSTSWADAAGVARRMVNKKDRIFSTAPNTVGIGDDHESFWVNADAANIAVVTSDGQYDVNWNPLNDEDTSSAGWIIIGRIGPSAQVLYNVPFGRFRLEVVAIPAATDDLIVLGS